MSRAPLLPNEPERLEALVRHELLDTAPECVFDALTSLAANLFEAPIALVSLVDQNRQWFKSQQGLGDRTSTERDIAFCSHAILQTGIFEIPDALEDARFADNPLVTGDPHIRFYAGMPLIDRAGLALGTLCVLDRVPRTLTQTQRDQLKMLAEAVVGIIVMRIRPSELQRYRRSVREHKATRSDLRARSKGLKALTRSVFLMDELTSRQNTVARNLPELDAVTPPIEV